MLARPWKIDHLTRQWLGLSCNRHSVIQEYPWYPGTVMWPGASGAPVSSIQSRAQDSRVWSISRSSASITSHHFFNDTSTRSPSTIKVSKESGQFYNLHHYFLSYSKIKSSFKGQTSTILNRVLLLKDQPWENNSLQNKSELILKVVLSFIILHRYQPSDILGFEEVFVYVYLVQFS